MLLVNIGLLSVYRSSLSIKLKSRLPSSLSSRLGFHVSNHNAIVLSFISGLFYS